MKFKISQPEFSKTLSLAGRSILAKANLPILSNVLISVSKNKLEVLSTNLETATKASTACQTGAEGKTAIAGRTLLEFVSQLPESEIAVEKLGEEVLVSTKGYNARIPTIAPEEFPAIPKIDKGHKILIKKGDFTKAVTEVAFCAAQDEGRPILTGVLCEFKEDRLSLVATDGYRLSFREIPIQKQSNGGNVKIVVPARALSEVDKVINEVFPGEDGEVSLVIADSLNQINFAVGSVEFTSRLIDGEFPGWQKIIPSTFTTKARLAKNEFIKLVRIAAIFARDSGSIVRLKLENTGVGKKGSLTVLANAAQVGSTDAQIEAEMSGKGGEIAFNYRYLLEVLSVINGDEVNFEMIESLNPGRITGADEKDSFFHIIMPVRLQT